MVKSAPAMVTKLAIDANYEAWKAWESSVEDWVFSHTSLYPADLGPISVRSIARMTMKPDLYTALDNAGAMGNRTYSGAQASWKTTMEHLKDKLGCNTAHLKIGLSLLKQGEMDMVSFA